MTILILAAKHNANVNFTFESCLNAITTSGFYLYSSRKIQKNWIVNCICIDRTIKALKHEISRKPVWREWLWYMWTEGRRWRRQQSLFATVLRKQQKWTKYSELLVHWRLRQFPPKSRYLRESHYRTALSQHWLRRELQFSECFGKFINATGVDIVGGLRAGRSGVRNWQGQEIYVISKASSSGHCLIRNYIPTAKLSGCEVNHSSPSSVQVKNKLSCAAAPTARLHGTYTGSFTFTLYTAIFCS